MSVSLTPLQEGPIKLLQITDTHLFEAEDGCLLSVNTEQSFKAVVNEILDSEFEYEAILATGDISQDHTSGSYQKFEDGIAPLNKPCFWLPGNHDYKPEMTSIIPSKQICDTTHVLLADTWQLILLDSQVLGVPHGRLSEDQLKFLESKLSEHSDRHSLVLLHHHPVLIGSAWLDQHTLHDSDQFWEVINRHSNVKGILCGHVHQDFVEMHHNVKVMTTPSTCVQFKPNSDEFALDTQCQGWRELYLHRDGELETHVKRLEKVCFTPDFAADGY
jgi:Icc protein